MTVKFIDKLPGRTVGRRDELIEFAVCWIKKHRCEVHFLARAGKEMALDRRSLDTLAAELGPAPSAAGRIPQLGGRPGLAGSGSGAQE